MTKRSKPPYENGRMGYGGVAKAYYMSLSRYGDNTSDLLAPIKLSGDRGWSVEAPQVSPEEQARKLRIYRRKIAKAFLQGKRVHFDEYARVWMIDGKEVVP